MNKLVYLFFLLFFFSLYGERSELSKAIAKKHYRANVKPILITKKRNISKDIKLVEKIYRTPGSTQLAFLEKSQTVVICLVPFLLLYMFLTNK